MAATLILRTIRISGPERARLLKRDPVMNENQINVTSIFSLPLAVTEAADAAALNAELAQFLLSREQDQYANQPPTPYLHKGVFESVSGVFQWPEPCIEKLRGSLIGTVGRIVAEVSGFSSQEMTNLVVLNQTRFQITRHGGGSLPHNHPMSSWSAVYCVHPGDDVPDHPESGVLRIIDPRLAANTYIDPANVRWRRPFGFGHISVKPQAGQLVIFPAQLLREVSAYLGEHPRITISTSFTFAIRPAQTQGPAPAQIPTQP